MFTGIIEDIGRIARVTPVVAGQRVVVHTQLDLRDTRLGDSIAVDGVCLTVVEQHGDEHGADVSFDVGPETLKVTAFGDLVVGKRVHLERALRMGDRLGGHLVSGHVDAIGALRERRSVGDALWLRFAAPASITRCTIHKGSIAINGTSLTVNAVDDGGFEVTLIPHTLDKTTLGDLRPGDVVNLEGDMIGKYVARLLGTGAIGGAGVTADLLRDAGFMDKR